MKKPTAGGFADVSQERLGKAQSPAMLAYVWTPYAALDRDNISFLAQCNIAHARALTEAGHLAAEDSGPIIETMADLIAHPDQLDYDPVRGDLFFNVEAYLQDRIGADRGGLLHIARSRIDLICAVMRLRTRDGLVDVLTELRTLQAALLELAGRHTDTLVQAYTHLQPAQVTTFGHYLLGFVDAFERDAERLEAALAHVNASPLGAAATSGSSWDFDRGRVAELLGFDGVVENTKDAGHSFDWLAEAVAAAAIAMNNLGRITWDLYIWCSAEFGLITIDGSYAASSSIMPQKRNPYSLEMLKARASELSTAPATILSVLLGDSGGTAFDIKLVGQAQATHVLTRSAEMLTLLTGVIETLHVNTDRMRARAGDGFSTAVGLVELLVHDYGLSFRTAHLVVGATVRIAQERGIEPRGVDAALVEEAAREVVGHELGIKDAAVGSSLDPNGFLEGRLTVGGPAPREVRRMFNDRAESLSTARERHEARVRAFTQRAQALVEPVS